MFIQAPDVPVNVENHQRHDTRRYQWVEWAQASPHPLPVLTEQVAAVSQPHAPDERTKERVNQESAEMHPGDARRQADESPHHGQQSGSENRPATAALKPATRQIKVVVGDQNVLAVFLEQGTAAPHPHPVSNCRTKRIAQRPVSTSQHDIGKPQRLFLDEHPAGEGHNQLARKGNTSALDSHQQHHAGPLHDVVNSGDEFQQFPLDRQHEASVTKQSWCRQIRRARRPNQP